MCGRFRPRSDKQKVVKTFTVTVGLEETEFESGTTSVPSRCSRSSTRTPTASVRSNSCDGPSNCRTGPSSNVRSEDIARSKFWKDAFAKGRVIVPGDAIFEWKEISKGQKKPKYEFTILGQEPLGMAGVWKLWKNPKTEQWEKPFAILTGEPNELMI